MWNYMEDEELTGAKMEEQDRANATISMKELNVFNGVGNELWNDESQIFNQSFPKGFNTNPKFCFSSSLLDHGFFLLGCL